MLTQSELAEALKKVNVKDVAALAGVSTKTIYRLRHQTNSPTLSNVEAIVAAIRAINPRALGKRA